MPGYVAVPPTVYRYQVPSFPLLLEKVGVPLWFPVINCPCFERKIRKTRHYTNVVGCSVKILHLELLPGSSGLCLSTCWCWGVGCGDVRRKFYFHKLCWY